jgi:hypothetical protein
MHIDINYTLLKVLMILHLIVKTRINRINLNQCHQMIRVFRNYLKEEGHLLDMKYLDKLQLFQYKHL